MDGAKPEFFCGLGCERYSVPLRETMEPWHPLNGSGRFGTVRVGVN